MEEHEARHHQGQGDGNGIHVVHLENPLTEPIISRQPQWQQSPSAPQADLPGVLPLALLTCLRLHLLTDAEAPPLLALRSLATRSPLGPQAVSVGHSHDGLLQILNEGREGHHEYQQSGPHPSEAMRGLCCHHQGANTQGGAPEERILPGAVARQEHCHLQGSQEHEEGRSCCMKPPPLGHRAARGGKGIERQDDPQQRVDQGREALARGGPQGAPRERRAGHFLNLQETLQKAARQKGEPQRQRGRGQEGCPKEGSDVDGPEHPAGRLPKPGIGLVEEHGHTISHVRALPPALLCEVLAPGLWHEGCGPTVRQKPNAAAVLVLLVDEVCHEAVFSHLNHHGIENRVLIDSAAEVCLNSSHCVHGIHRTGAVKRELEANGALAQPQHPLREPVPHQLDQEAEIVGLLGQEKGAAGCQMLILHAPVHLSHVIRLYTAVAIQQQESFWVGSAGIVVSLKQRHAQSL
mmetsp:Transcript_53440/g.125380  ORF Transcript_53440/g.125380 Transcript_53440/m.125380 type:complete len:464 (-) Transcript_53440:700-2091(-)